MAFTEGCKALNIDFSLPTLKLDMIAHAEVLGVPLVVGARE